MSVRLPNDQEINQIAKLAKIRDESQISNLGALLRRAIAWACSRMDGLERAPSGKVTANKSDIKAVESIAKLASKLNHELGDASPYVRALLSQLLLLPRTPHGKIPPPLEELQEAVSILHACSGPAHGILLAHRHWKPVGDIFFQWVFEAAEQCGGRLRYSGTDGGSLGKALEVLRPYLPKELAKLSDQTAWRAINRQQVSKTEKNSDPLVGF